ncbi:MAG: hypothetical protein JO033_18205 [Acidobacteriaceae bacterium]|nr:hypothetical protein [Acidobacteriaceae bacterium]MBV9500758.1 hypothetical protein [Acidobacteriaceae bacterium]
MKFLVFPFLAVSLLAAPPKLSYSRSFPGSTPEYFELTVDRTGQLEYTESVKKDDQPLKTVLPEADTAALFALAQQLNYFKDPLESGLKVANTGKKTFRYEPENGPASQAVFNYSSNETAQQLLKRFEDIASTEHAYIDLDTSVHFDKLGVNDALAEIEALWLHKQLAAPSQFIPLLTRIATHDSFMHLVRERAARLKDEFQSPPASVAVSSQK